MSLSEAGGAAREVHAAGAVAKTGSGLGRAAPRGQRIAVPESALWGLAYGAGWAGWIDVGGRLYLAEIVALAGLALLRGAPSAPRGRGEVLAGLALLLAGLAVADTLAGSAPSDLARGWATPLLAAANVLFLLRLLARGAPALAGCLAGLALAGLAGLAPGSAGALGENYFKAEIVPVLRPLVLLAAFAAWPRAPRLVIAGLLAVGLAFVLLHARSMGAVFLLGGLVLFVLGGPVRQRPLRALLLAAALAMAAPALWKSYVGWAQGQPGSNAALQFAALGGVPGPVALVFAARPELLVTAQAIAERPLAGHGSWAEDGTGRHLRAALADPGGPEAFAGGWIRSHSVVLTAWLWAGLAGLAGVALIAAAVLARVPAAVRSAGRVLPVLVVLGIEAAFHLVFSPIGHLRLTLPLAIALVLLGAAGALAGRTIALDGTAARSAA